MFHISISYDKLRTTAGHTIHTLMLTTVPPALFFIDMYCKNIIPDLYIHKLLPGRFSRFEFAKLNKNPKRNKHPIKDDNIDRHTSTDGILTYCCHQRWFLKSK